MNSNVTQALHDIKLGKPIILVDDYNRENEGDIVIAGEKANIDNLAFTMLLARGLMCVPCTGKVLDRLEIPPMVTNNTDKNQTPFAVSVDASHGITTGMSVQDRLRTIKELTSKTSTPSSFNRPGHIFPLRAKDGLLTDRRGHTEGSVTLMRLAGLHEVAVICEIMNTDGTMSNLEDLTAFSDKHGLVIVSIDEISEIPCM